MYHFHLKFPGDCVFHHVNNLMCTDVLLTGDLRCITRVLQLVIITAQYILYYDEM